MNVVAEQWWTAIGRASIEGGLALALVWIVCRCFRRIPAWAQCWLWRLACLKLLFSFCSDATIKAPLLPAPKVSAIPITVSSPANIDRSALSAVSVRQSLPVVQPVTQSKFVEPAAALFAIWMTVVFFGLARMGFQFRTVLQLRRSGAANAELAELARDLSKQLDASAPPILVSALISKPLLAGIFKPVILFPAGLVNWDRQQIRMMLSHELAHLKRHDLTWNYVGALAHLLFWFHPVVWIGSREWRLAQEMACDELALRKEPSRAVELANILIDLAARKSSDSAPKILTAGIIETKSTLERRLRGMKLIRSGRAARMAAMVILCAATFAILPWRIVAQKAAEPTAAEPARAEKQKIEPERPAETPPNDSFDSSDARKLAEKELALVQQQLETAKLQAKNGVISNEEVARHSREVEHLNQEIALLDGNWHGYKASVAREIALVKELRDAEAARQKLGVSSGEARLKLERELLQLGRRVTLASGLPPGGPVPSGVAQSGPATNSMMFYMQNPELMKRYFPQMYARMQAGSNGVPPGFSGQAPRRSVMQMRADLNEAFQLASVEISQQRTNEAYVILQQMLNRPDADASTIVSVAHAFSQLGNISGLEAALQRLVQVIPESPEAWYDLSRAQVVARKTDEALKSLKRAIKFSNERLLTNPNAKNLAAQALNDASLAPMKTSSEFQTIINAK